MDIPTDIDFLPIGIDKARRECPIHAQVSTTSTHYDF